MNKERQVIEPNAIVVFDGSVRWTKFEELFQDFKGDIIITGDLILEKDSLITCDNLYVMGNLCEEDCVDVIVEGNLYVEGDIDCCKITVNGFLFCNKYISTFEINVAQDLYAKTGIDSNGYDINVGGELVCEADVTAAEITVLKKISVSDRIEADSIRVG